MKAKRTIDDYKDIIDLPHHVSKTRAKMPLKDRAAQFAPFAAVVGHEAAIKETARYVDRKKELDEMEKSIIDEKLNKINSWLPEKHEIELMYFKPDNAKRGGEYVSKIGYVKKIDTYNLEVLFADGTRIEIGQIYSIDL